VEKRAPGLLVRPEGLRFAQIVQAPDVSIEYFDILFHEPEEERTMTKPIPAGSTILVPVSRVDGQPTDLLDLRIEELARRERDAVARGDWRAARSTVLEKVRLRDAHQRTMARSRA